MRPLIVISGLVLAVSIAFDLYPGLRGGAGWQWTYVPSQLSGAVLALAVGLLAYVAVSGVLMRARRARALVVWAVLGGAAIGYLVTGTQGDIGYTLFTRTVSPVQTGASALATRIMAAEGILPTLQRWPSVMQQSLDANLIHFTTSPPGQVLFHQLLADLLDAPALSAFVQPLSQHLRQYQCADVTVMRSTNGEIVSAGAGVLFPLVAALLALPLYLLARDLTGDRHAAARLAVWGALLPSVGLFAPTWNTIYPVLCLLAFWLLLRALQTRRLGWAGAAGVVLSLTTFLNFSVLPMLLLMGLFTLGYTLLTDPQRAAGARALVWPVTVGMVFGVGLLSVWMVFWAVSGVSPVAILTETFTSHKDLVVREYAPWLVLHVWDVMLFTGLPAALLAVWGTVRALRNRTFGALDALTLSMAATVILVNFAGIVQGENARILIFYMPFLLLMGMGVLRDQPLRWQSAWLGAQAAVVLAMAYALYVVPLDMNLPNSGARTDIGGLDGIAFVPMDARFEGGEYAGRFGLRQMRHVSDPSVQAITFEFEWVGGLPTERPYQLELVASAQDPELGLVQSEPLRWTPQGGYYPPTCWRDGEAVRDVIVLRVPVVSAPVVWEVLVRAVDERTGDVLRVAGGTDALTLPPVRYP